MPSAMTRRSFVAAAGAAALARADEPIIDTHQHVHFHGRGDEALVAHQRTMGAASTVLLPGGSKAPLDAQVTGNETALAIVRRYPREFFYFANEDPTLPGASKVIEKHLKTGAIGIGEQKFHVECDSKWMVEVAEVAREFRVPVIMHFEHERYNMGIERFHKMLERFPKVNFIGHAQTWWGNIGKNHVQTVMYPKGNVTPGGISDRLLTDYPNMYADLSAGSGLNALLRDEEHTREFLARHQDKLLYGTDCADIEGKGEKCSGSQCQAAVRRLAGSKRIERKILFENAMKLLRLG